ncbi:PREDICTED: uncharacterized protein LOC104816950 [Tarenaya hassleriana]|uniref:uncharacterized protein LOC104816950 n=1 Tax=Tarenaya hassleriana TaxID=28532 RepID=UPI00053C12EA|nr:PREDICTED: uncharacterized protein LOC104816950 [Tarenaya hassleriana]
MEGVEHRTVRGIGGDIHVAVKGPEGRVVVLLIHGFPELWYSWRHQISGLAALGFRAVAPDLRGCGDSHAPPEISSYSLFHIVEDLVAVISAVTADDDERVFVVGHDWGSVC